MPSCPDVRAFALASRRVALAAVAVEACRAPTAGESADRRAPPPPESPAERPSGAHELTPASRTPRRCERRRGFVEVHNPAFPAASAARAGGVQRGRTLRR